MLTRTNGMHTKRILFEHKLKHFSINRLLIHIISLARIVLDQYNF